MADNLNTDESRNPKKESNHESSIEQFKEEPVLNEDEMEENDPDELVHSMHDKLPSDEDETDVDEEIHQQPPNDKNTDDETDIDDLVHSR